MASGAAIVALGFYQSACVIFLFNFKSH